MTVLSPSVNIYFNKWESSCVGVSVTIVPWILLLFGVGGLVLGFRGWGLGLGPKAPSSGALLLQGAQVAEGPSAEAQQYPEPYSIQKPNSIHKPTAGARKKGAKRPEFLVS